MNGLEFRNQCLMYHQLKLQQLMCPLCSSGNVWPSISHILLKHLSLILIQIKFKAPVVHRIGFILENKLFDLSDVTSGKQELRFEPSSCSWSYANTTTSSVFYRCFQTACVFFSHPPVKTHRLHRKRSEDKAAP